MKYIVYIMIGITVGFAIIHASEFLGKTLNKYHEDFYNHKNGVIM